LNLKATPSSDHPLATRAAYREPRIKTYGFEKMTDLSMFEISAGRAAMGSLGLALCSMGDEGAPFHLVFSLVSSEGLEFCLVTQRPWAKVIRKHMDLYIAGGAETVIRETAAVELVFFQGPHFGDRYGILDATVRALACKGIRMKAVVCSGACVYIVLPEGKSGEAVKVLSESFEIPGASQSTRHQPMVSDERENH
jgi:aspartokinase